VITVVTTTTSYAYAALHKRLAHADPYHDGAPLALVVIGAMLAATAARRQARKVHAGQLLV